MNKFKFLQIAERIVSLKIEIERLSQSLDVEKAKMQKYITDGEVIPVAQGEVFSRTLPGSKSLPRESTLAYIEKKYGKDVARDINLNCTKVNKATSSICVRTKSLNYR
jgi:hypothetical protein